MYVCRPDKYFDKTKDKYTHNFNFLLVNFGIKVI